MDDERWLRASFRNAEASRARGDQPFGAVLVSAAGRVLGDGFNTRNSSRDLSGHAEMNVIREAAANHWTQLRTSTLYTSTEPCMMCARLIAWSGIGRLVFGLSQASLNRIPSTHPPRFSTPTDVRVLLGGVYPPVEVAGPLLEAEAMGLHDGYWS